MQGYIRIYIYFVTVRMYVCVCRRGFSEGYIWMVTRLFSFDNKWSIKIVFFSLRKIVFEKNFKNPFDNTRTLSLLNTQYRWVRSVCVWVYMYLFASIIRDNHCAIVLFILTRMVDPFVDLFCYFHWPLFEEGWKVKGSEEQLPIWPKSQLSKG